jgi:hypothetical protein
MNTAILRLFNAVLVETDQHVPGTASIRKRTIRNGYILDPRIDPSDDLLSKIENIVGLSGEKANAAFHKSWAVIRDTPMEELILQQALHYLTTYGFQNMGIYRESSIYIPHEILNCPDITDELPLTVIRAFDKYEILAKIIELGSGIALTQETLKDIMSIVAACKFDPNFVACIENRELEALLFDHYNLVPTEPVDFLRHLVFKLTDETLLIKNGALIAKLHSANGNFLDELLKDAPDNLASIFYRYKPLFLAMKKISRNKAFFNRLRKDAPKQHVPLKPDYMNNVTAQIKRNELNLEELSHKLEQAPIFRQIRLAYALNFRLHHTGSVVYRIRNGWGWATDFSWPNNRKELLVQALAVVTKSIADKIRSNIEDKIIYIPSTVNYALPATEKQFTGHFPSGSYVCVPKDLIFGIHWFNTKRDIDLDLSVIGKSGKYGWDAMWSDQEQTIMFSGDITSAPRPQGATELFYLKSATEEPRLINVNYFNFAKKDYVDCKLFAAQHALGPGQFTPNYMIDINKMVAQANIQISKKQSVLGAVLSVAGENRVYFSNFGLGNSITANNDKGTSHARDYLFTYGVNAPSLKGILELAGGIVIDVKPEEGDYIDLSPEALDRTTIINLIAN